jgi:5'-nucleotidase
LFNKTLPYKIFRKNGIRVGVFGIGIELKGLVDPKLYGNTVYEDAIKHALNTSEHLKKEQDCDLVICLSHLGYKYEEKKISDEVLAKESSYIDLIIGGHTHTFLDTPVKYMNRDGKEIFVAQVGWAGIRLGRIDYIFSSKRKKKDMMTSTVKISENTIAS